MNQGHVSEVIGAENAKLLDGFMRESGIPLMVLISGNVAAIAQAQGTEVDYLGLAAVLRQLADQSEALVASRPMVLH